MRRTWNVFWIVAGAVASAQISSAAAQAPAQPAAPGTPTSTTPAKPPAITERVEVTATRVPLAVDASATTVLMVDSVTLLHAPAFTLDDMLRQHAGFELFRRSSSWVANPTTEGISLRGLGSTAASRTLVLLDGVPYADPFGGWVHWSEIPPLALGGVELAQGGGSDLYGSSAMGGVIDILPAIPTGNGIYGEFSGGGQGLIEGQLRADAAVGGWHILGAGQGLKDDGYIPIAQQYRGPVDDDSNVQSRTGRLMFVRPLAQRYGQNNSFILSGNLLDETRQNGTQVSNNGTRLWRYAAALNEQLAPHIGMTARLYGSQEAYSQSFDSVNATRTVDLLTRLQKTHTQELGASAQAAWSPSRRLLGGNVVLLGGGDGHDIRSVDHEQTITNGLKNGFLDITARQRFTGGFGEALWSRGRWNVAFSARGDKATNMDARQLNTTVAGVQTTTPYSNRSEGIFSPRLGLVRRLPHNVSLRATAFRAFRTPTQNELYRNGQVGQELTLNNPYLVSERATGWEGGALWTSHRVDIQGTYFGTIINRPVSAVLQSQTSTTITDKRLNLGQIRSEGVALDTTLGKGLPVYLTASYQYVSARVTKFSAQPALVGNRIPQVPGHTVAATLTAQRAKLGLLAVTARYSSLAYDDAANQFELHPFSRFDIYGEHRFGSRVTLYGSVQNLLNRSIEVARTPLLQYGTPQLGLLGLRVSLQR